MATKWKRTSRSKGFKGLLALIVLAAAAAIGAITGYLPASGYLTEYELSDLTMHSDYFESVEYVDRLSDVENDVWQYGSFADAVEDYERQGVFLRIENKSYRFGNDVSPAVVFRLDSRGLALEKGDSRYLPRGYLVLGMEEGKVIYFGFTEADLAYREQQWNISHNNMLIILFSDLALAVIAVAAAVLLIRVIGENSDGEPVFNSFFVLWYEVTVALLVSAVMIIGVAYSSSWRYMWDLEFGFRPTFEKIWYMVVWGLSALGAAAILLYLVLCISVRVKNRSFRKGFLCYNILFALWRAGKAAGRFTWSLFTGEMFAADRAAKKLLVVDCVFLGTGVVLGTIALLCFSSRNYGGVLVFLVLWVIALALFLYGRVRMVTDEAQLEQQIRELSRGNYTYSPKLSRNSAYAKSSEVLSSISVKYKRGIEESVKAERMKIELVTNVSHDLKTPLTSIISYVELLSKEELTPKATEYVGILQKKSERLKNIVSDVFELAKTTSGEISVERERLDLTRLSNQTLAEMEDKITAAGFTIKTNICEPPVEVISDGKRLYRVIQNLMDNALKYSLKGTRIFYTLEKTEERAVITIKNISSYEMDFTKEEILERFTRGDKARSTEGSGLGLSIAQGFTIACGGQFDIDIDGDMFKVVLTFPTAAPEQEKQPVAALSAVNADE